MLMRSEPGLVVVVVVVLEGHDIAVLGLRVLVPAVAGDLAAAVVELRVAQLGRDRPVGAPPAAKAEPHVVPEGVLRVAGVGPVVAGVVDDHVQDDLHGRVPAVGLPPGAC
jgi:hypothetical protein